MALGVIQMSISGCGALFAIRFAVPSAADRFCSAHSSVHLLFSSDHPSSVAERLNGTFCLSIKVATSAETARSVVCRLSNEVTTYIPARVLHSYYP